MKGCKTGKKKMMAEGGLAKPNPRIQPMPRPPGNTGIVPPGMGTTAKPVPNRQLPVQPRPNVPTPRQPMNNRELIDRASNGRRPPVKPLRPKP